MNTQFNPFGAQEEAVSSVKMELKEVISRVETEISEGISGKSGLSADSKNFGAVMEKLTAICKEIDETAIQSLLSEFIAPLSRFAGLLSTSNDKLKPAEFASLCRSMAKFVQIVADRIVEPFGSDLLEQWAPLFDALFASTKSSILLKDMGVALWKATFGTVKGALRYPGELRQSLEKLPKKSGVILPPEEKKSTTPIIFDEEEEAMDGMSSGTSSDDQKTSDEKVTEVESQSSTFQFSQQPEADEMAEKLLKEAKMKEEREKAEKTPNRKETPTRRRASRMSLLDEDSSDFVPITTTPPSSRRSRLTDRQKEKLAEAMGPRTTTNYVDEESQSGFQKRQQMTEALNKLNYDVGEDSVSVLVSSSPKTENPTESKKADEFESPPFVQNPPNSPPKSARRSAIRARRLFDNIEKASDEASEKARKKFESSDGKEDSEDVTEKEKKVEFVEAKKEEEEAVDSPRKTRGRAKGIPKKSESTPHPKKRLRSSIIKKEPSSEDIKEVDEEDVKSPESKKVKKATEPVKIEEPTCVLEKALEVEHVPLGTSSEVEQKTSEVAEDSEPEMLEKSPPKTPRTPSILRVGKRAAVDGSPMTERKKNRVHFNEDSLPQEAAPSSPHTPRRNQVVLAVDVKSPQKTTTSSTSTSSTSESVDTTSSEHPMGLLEISDPTSSTSPFFKNLVGCQDPIEKVVRKLAPMCLKTAVDTVKKSLQKAGVRTVGEFASLSRRQLNDIAGLKHPKEKCARSVLAEYEAMKKEEQRASEERILEGVEGVEVKKKTCQKLFDDVAVKSGEEKTETLQPIAKIVDFSDSQNDVEMEEVTEKLPRIPEDVHASQSPTSPVKPTSSHEDVRKNLAPIFDKTRVKKEPPTPQKEDVGEKMKQAIGSTMVDDARLLHRISCSLSRAHSLNQLPSDEWTNLLDVINKSAILFKNIVQERGALLDEWDDVENNENSQESATSPEEDVKSLRGVYRRFSRHHSIGDVTDATWQKVMESVNEAALLLRSIVVERAPRN